MLFGLGKKEEKCCSCKCDNETSEKAENLKKEGGIKVLGGGCAKCHALEANTQEALKELGIVEDVEMITDFGIIATYGVMSTPALVIDGKVVSYGKVLNTKDIVQKIKEERNV